MSIDSEVYVAGSGYLVATVISCSSLSFTCYKQFCNDKSRMSGTNFGSVAIISYLSNVLYIAVSVSLLLHTIIHTINTISDNSSSSLYKYQNISQLEGISYCFYGFGKCSMYTLLFRRIVIVLQDTAFEYTSMTYKLVIILLGAMFLFSVFTIGSIVADTDGQYLSYRVQFILSLIWYILDMICSIILPYLLCKKLYQIATRIDRTLSSNKSNINSNHKDHKNNRDVSHNSYNYNYSTQIKSQMSDTDTKIATGRATNNLNSTNNKNSKNSQNNVNGVMISPTSTSDRKMFDFDINVDPKNRSVQTISFELQPSTSNDQDQEPQNDDSKNMRHQITVSSAKEKATGFHTGLYQTQTRSQTGSPSARGVARKGQMSFASDHQPSDVGSVSIASSQMWNHDENLTGNRSDWKSNTNDLILLKLVVKFSVLSICVIVSSLSVGISVIVSDITQSQLAANLWVSFDSTVNSICIILYFGFMHQYYRNLCNCCDSACRAIVGWHAAFD